MSKPEFSKEFNLEHAKAGAPYCQMDGSKAVIFKWDMKGECPLAGYGDSGFHDDEMAIEWFADGRPEGAFGDTAGLVMAPLAILDGKPIFVGSELEQRVRDGWVRNNAQASWAAQSINWTEDLRWPAPARIYPVTQMTNDELYAVWARPAPMGACINVANAALRHAIDDGQVITADEHKAEIADLHSKWVAQVTEMNGKRAERDMAVARAAKKAVLRAWALSDEEEEGHAMESIGLEAIISSVTP